MNSQYEDKLYYWQQGYAAFINPLESQTPPCINREAWRQWLAGFDQAKNDLPSEGEGS